MNENNFVSGGRTLIQQLQVIPKSQAIKVGSKDGSGFFYCGTAGDFAENIDKISADMEKFFKDNDARATAELANLANRIPRYPRLWQGDLKMDMDDWFKAMSDRAKHIENRTGELTRFIIDLGKWAAKIDDVRRTAQNAKWKADSFTELRTRPVADSFFADRAADPEEPFVIILFGHEPGKWWTMEESRNG